MEDLAPPLLLSLEIRRALDNGEHVRTGIKKFLESKKSDFHSILLRWLMLVERGEKVSHLLTEIKSPHRRALLDLLEKSFKGQSISSPLRDLEEEIGSAAQAEVDAYISRLPFIALVPLLLFQFPAFMLLLIGPILLEAVSQMGGM
ncbi:MAG: hypothetical protein AB7O96_04775 [Pseudobdellovibrionaceae bacterium]